MVPRVDHVDHRGMDEASPPIWRPSSPTPVHSTGVALTFLAAMPAVYFAALLYFSGSCGETPSADEVRSYRLLFLATALGFAAVPAGIGVWALRRGRAPLAWFGLAGISLAAGSVFAFGSEPIPLFCF